MPLTLDIDLLDFQTELNSKTRLISGSLGFWFHLVICHNLNTTYLTLGATYLSRPGTL